METVDIKDIKEVKLIGYISFPDLECVSKLSQLQGMNLDFKQIISENLHSNDLEHIFDFDENSHYFEDFEERHGSDNLCRLYKKIIDTVINDMYDGKDMAVDFEECGCDDCFGYDYTITTDVDLDALAEEVIKDIEQEEDIERE